MWTKEMRRTSEDRREEVLIDVRAFTPALISHLGSEIASKLDEAIRLGGGEAWP
jgi:hypothetical protein